jgi:hypothetical protein
MLENYKDYVEMYSFEGIFIIFGLSLLKVRRLCAVGYDTKYKAYIQPPAPARILSRGSWDSPGSGGQEEIQIKHLFGTNRLEDKLWKQILKF